MSSSPTRTRRTQTERRETTRRALINATYQGILEAGYHSTTTRRVAEMSGVSLGAVAHHFPTRIGLVIDTLDHVGQLALENLLERLQSFEGNHEEQARFALDLLWEYFGGDIFVVWLKIWIAADEEPDLLAAMQPVERKISDLIATIAEEVTPGSMRHTRSRNKVRFALATMRGLGVSRLLAPNHPTAVVGWESARAELMGVLEISGA